MFSTCAKAVLSEAPEVLRLYESEHFANMASKTQDPKSQQDIMKQALNAKKQISKLKEMYFVCFNRFFYSYSIFKEISSLEIDGDLQDSFEE